MSLAATVDVLGQYGISKQAFVSCGTSLYEAIAYQAPSLPLECYALAAHAELDELAVAVSPYTLSLSLPDISNQDAEHMGARYLKRLFFLHIGRVEALKRILRPLPTPHPPTECCDGLAERPFREAWINKVADIVWTASPSKYLCLTPCVSFVYSHMPSSHNDLT